MSNQKPIIVLKRCYPIPRHSNSLLKPTEPSHHIQMPVRRVVSQAYKNGTEEGPTFASNSSNGAKGMLQAISKTENSTRNQITIPQLEFLIHCMEHLPELARACSKSKYDRLYAFRKWNQIANVLNKIEPSSARTGKKWMKYWTDQKHKVRRLLEASEQRSLQTGKPRKLFSPFQERLIKILKLLKKGQGDHKYKNDPDEVEMVPTEQLDVISDTNIPKGEVEVSEPEAVLVARSPSPTPDEVLQEDPIDIDVKMGKPSIEDLQVELLQFNVRKQKEMHDLEIACMIERHKLELEILELKKKILNQELQKKNDNNSKKVSYKILPKHFIKP